MKIAVFGAGGVGGYLGGLLAQNYHNVTFIARGEHLEAIKTRGLQVKSVHGDFCIQPTQATDDPGDVSGSALHRVSRLDLPGLRPG